MKTPEIFVDLSYILYDSLFSAVKIYKEEFNPIMSVENPINFVLFEDFCNIFKSRFNAKLWGGIRSKYPLARAKDVVFCRDCSKKNIWRRDEKYDPLYKQNRIDSAKEELDYDLGAIFNYFYTYMLKDLEDQGVITISHYNCEADDIFFILTENKVKKLGLTKESSAAYANDGDWLHNIDYITKEFDSRGKEREFPDGMSLKNWRLMKLILGDKKDNVMKSVFLQEDGGNAPKRTGPKFAEKFFDNPELLIEAFENKILDREKFALNKILLLPSGIPDLIRDEVWNDYLKKREIEPENLIINL